MQTPKSAGQKPKYKNPIEAIGDVSRSVASSTTDSLRGIGGGVVDAFLGSHDMDDDMDMWGQEGSPMSAPHEKQPTEAPPKKLRQELFRFVTYHETVQKKQEMNELLRTIHEEIKSIRTQSAALASEMNDIEAIAINETTTNGNAETGIYDVRFMEALLMFLRNLRTKIGESGTWMQALMSKKAKRGSLFAKRSKSQGTQYSMSQELQVTRSVQ